MEIRLPMAEVGLNRSFTHLQREKESTTSAQCGKAAKPNM